MSTQPNKKPTLSLDGFRGVDHRADHKDGRVASDLINFRIREDGSLEKRPGYRLLADLGGPVRAFFTRNAEGKEIAYALVQSTLYAVDLLTGEKSVLGTVATHDGDACFFFYKSLLYLMDEKDIYIYENGTLSPAVGYVPLIGKDWVNDYVGEPYEPKNILTRRARISYVVSESRPSIFMCTGEPVESVDIVYRNGVLVDPEDYYIDEGFQTINVIGSDKGDRLEIYMTMKNGHEERRKLFLTSNRSTVFGGMEDYRLFFWDCDDPSLIFCSSFVPREQVLSSARYGGNGNDIYIPVGYEFRVGAVEHRIQGCASHYERLLIFTENDTWMASSDVSGVSELSLSAINTEIGCAPLDGVAAVGNTPISIGRNSLYQWHQESDLPDRCNAKRMSEAIDGLFSLPDYRNSGLYYDRYRNELWFFNRETGVVWIRNLTCQDWFRFTGIFADQLFDAGGQVGFLREGALYVFDDTAYTDWRSDGDSAPIEAKYVGALTDFDCPDKKNLSALTLRGDGGGGSLFLTFSEDGEREVSYPLFEGETASHLVLKKRLSSGRFRYGRLTLTAPNEGRPVIHSLTLHTR